MYTAPLISVRCELHPTSRIETMMSTNPNIDPHAPSGERIGNLKCINQTCFAIWLPYKVGSNERLTKGPGVNGTLSKLQRVRARFFQVMLNGRPLYRYVGDNNTKGSAKGQNIRSFGGTWSAVTP